MKLKQLKITNYFVKNIKKNNKIKNNKLYQICKKIKKTHYDNNFKGKLFRKTMKKKVINERKIKYCLYELSRVRI